jgi:hypothetical protein
MTKIEGEMKVIENGKLQIKKTTEIKGVTPQMVAWYAKDRNKDSYKMWHPDHIDYKCIKNGPNGGHVGSVYLETQKLGKHIYKMKKTIFEYSDTVSAITLKFPLFTIRSRTISDQKPTITIRRTTQVIGTDMPVVGRLWNWYLRKLILPEFLRDHDKHAAEERENYTSMLPKLYNEAMRKMK